MLGLNPGGNKTRKLEFLAADALAQGADTLITCGAPQSNHCRTTLSAAVKEGLQCRFVIEERVPNSYRQEASGNNFMFRLMGVEDLSVVTGGSDMMSAMNAVSESLTRVGRKGYIIPGGGSNALGGLGYVDCTIEMERQWREQNLRFDRLIVASGSSGTHGGLVAGFAALGITMPILGIGVSRDPVDQDPLVHREAQATADLLGLGKTIPQSAVQTNGDYWRPKYSVPNEGMIEAVRMLARTEAILVDPVYTGKTLAGLIDLTRRGQFAADQNILFLHTGGATALHAYEDVLLQ